MFKPIISAKESKTAFERFKHNFASGAKAFQEKRVGYQGGASSCDVYWHHELGVWGLFVPKDAKRKYWICFGTQSPAFHSMLTITVEANPPIQGVNRRSAGIFLSDQRGNSYIAHSGRVGGGRKGIGMKAFKEYSANATWSNVVWPNGKSSECRVISRLDSPNLQTNLAEFIHEVASFKRQAVSG
jgi:hypothetical protein